MGVSIDPTLRPSVRDEGNPSKESWPDTSVKPSKTGFPVSKATQLISTPVTGSPSKTSSRVKRNLHAYFEEYAGVKASYYSTVRFAPLQSAESLIIHDTEDKEAPYHYATKIHELWPNSRMMTTSGLGHKLRDISVVNEVVAFFD